MDYSLEVMASRVSVRSYDGKPIAPGLLRDLSAAVVDSVPGPFGGRARFVVLGPELEEGTSSGQLLRSGSIGTYGLISKVSAFIAGAIAKAPHAFEDFGYSMEGLVLKATELGLGSCWIGGLFDRGAAGAALELGQDEYLPAVVSIGLPANKKSVAESITRRLARAGTRKPFEELFFADEMGASLHLPSAPWRRVLEAVRMAPSASNKQPWRILATGPEGRLRFDLLLEEDRRYNSMLGAIRLQNIDMGIAMRHFESAAHSLGLPGAWTRIEPYPLRLEGPRSYIASWIV
ncbi:MAG TPA: nitroreductase family protein [Rectinemataceae bacterium]|nr:nitroreductase family protein [Rectinemataceae bacterium]